MSQSDRVSPAFGKDKCPVRGHGLQAVVSVVSRLMLSSAMMASAGLMLACGGSSPTDAGETPPPTAPPPPPTAPPPPPAAPPVGSSHLSLRAIAGTWVGVVTEFGSTPWKYRVRITVADSAVIDSAAATIVYSDSGFTNPLPLSCSGDLELRSISGTSHVFFERLTAVTNCINFASVVLAPISSDSVSYTWVNRQNVPSAGARLSRISP